jgi:hypothetical protein
MSLQLLTAAESFGEKLVPVSVSPPQTADGLPGSEPGLQQQEVWDYPPVLWNGPILWIFSLKVGWVWYPSVDAYFTLAYYAFPRWYEFGERRWNDILTGENRRTRRKTCPSATLSTTNPTWIEPGANPGLRGERPGTNDLSHGTAYMPVGYWLLVRGGIVQRVPCNCGHCLI